MTPGAKATLTLYTAAIIWDLKCPPGQTLSEALARGIKDKHTRYPLTALLLITTAHLFALARKQ